MSILIKGMDKIPKDGADLVVKHDDDGKAYIKYVGMMGYSMELVELPEKHGELIDRDEVRDSVFHHLSIKGEENLLPAEKSVFGNIIKAKAVIEAEGEK